MPGPGRFETVGIATQPSFAIGSAVEVFNGAPNNSPVYTRSFDIMSDGKHLVDVIDAGLGQTGAPSSPQIQVVLHWFEELKQRVPTGR